MPDHNLPNTEIKEPFRDKAAWDAWVSANRHLVDRDAIESIVAAVRKRGLVDPFRGRFAPTNIQIWDDNYRETIECGKAKSRGRAVLTLLKDIVGERGRMPDVYACESITEFAMALREIFPRFVGSEYLPDNEKEKFPSVRHEDIQSLSFPDGAFDIYVSCEVLEHIPFMDQALREAKRILRTGGTFLGTVPFANGNETTIVKARMNNGAIEYLAEPEYHGNLLEPGSKGSLVFEIPGWDLLARLKAAGFRDASMTFVMSASMGIVAPHTGGIHCFVARA